MPRFSQAPGEGAPGSRLYRPCGVLFASFIPGGRLSPSMTQPGVPRPRRDLMAADWLYEAGTRAAEPSVRLSQLRDIATTCLARREGLEPPTPRFEAWCSDPAELPARGGSEAARRVAGRSGRAPARRGAGKRGVRALSRCCGSSPAGTRRGGSRRRGRPRGTPSRRRSAGVPGPALRWCRWSPRGSRRRS